MPYQAGHGHGGIWVDKTAMYHSEHPAKAPHKFSTQTDRDSLSQQRVTSYMTSQNGGGDPITALAVRDKSTTSSISDRNAKVARLLHDNMALYENETPSGT
jgi:hypothetical protein